MRSQSCPLSPEAPSTVAVRRFKVVLEWDRDESLWLTYVPALNHLSTYGETKESALAETREAILGYIEAAQKEA